MLLGGDTTISDSESDNEGYNLLPSVGLMFTVEWVRFLIPGVVVVARVVVVAKVVVVAERLTAVVAGDVVVVMVVVAVVTRMLVGTC